MLGRELQLLALPVERRRLRPALAPLCTAHALCRCVLLQNRPEHGMTKASYLDAVFAGLADYASSSRRSPDIAVRLLLRYVDAELVRVAQVVRDGPPRAALACAQGCSCDGLIHSACAEGCSHTSNTFAASTGGRLLRRRWRLRGSPCPSRTMAWWVSKAYSTAARPQCVCRPTQPQLPRPDPCSCRHAARFVQPASSSQPAASCFGEHVFAAAAAATHKPAVLQAAPCRRWAWTSRVTPAWGPGTRGSRR